MVKVHGEGPPPISYAASASALPSTPYSAMGRKLFIGGNWKCNGTVNELMLIIDDLNSARVPATDLVDLVVSPPFVFLHLTMNTLRPEFQVAAQNCWVKKGGPYTGEISAEMLVNVGVKWVIIGHSERRALMGETNEFVGEKVAYALSQGLKSIACVGENLEQRKSGSTMEVIAAQVKAIAVTDWTNVVIAYEPVWAVGTDKVASPDQAQEVSPDQAQEVHSDLRKWLHANTSAAVAESTRIIYGGCVNAGNCKDLAGKAVDGFLVGEASLMAEFYQLFDSLELVNELKLPSDTVEKIANMKLAELAKIYSDVGFEFDADAAQKEVEDILKRIEKEKMSHTELLDDLNFRISSAKTEVTLSVRERRHIFSQFDELYSAKAKIEKEKELAESLGGSLSDRDEADRRKIPGMIESLISRIKKWENRHGSDVVNSDGIRLLTILEEDMVEQEKDPDFNPQGESETESDDMNKYVVEERGLKKR